MCLNAYVDTYVCTYLCKINCIYVHIYSKAIVYVHCICIYIYSIISTKEVVIQTIENDANRHFGIRASVVQIQSREAFLQLKNDGSAEPLS